MLPLESTGIHTTESLWVRLKQIQTESYDKLNGLFPSSRSHPWGYRREDYSAYFTATVLHSLMRLEPFLSPEESGILESIRQTACEGVAPFQNKQGLLRYNFWQTNPGRHFPNGKLLGRWERYRPPDDVDDSVMIYQMQQRSLEESLWLKEHIDSYANGHKGKWVNNTPPPYRILRAYCTFFCKDMPLGFDACVITNVLYFNRLHGFEENFKEKDSVEYLVTMLRRKDHFRQPEQVAPYYPQTSIIVYHLVKLISRFSFPALDERRIQVLDDVQYLLKKPLLKTERIMLENAWMWLTSSLPPKTGGEELKGDFHFFVLPLTLEFEGTFAQWFAHMPVSRIRFSCPALDLSLELENQILRRQVSRGVVS